MLQSIYTIVVYISPVVSLVVGLYNLYQVFIVQKKVEKQLSQYRKVILESNNRQDAKLDTLIEETRKNRKVILG